MSTEIAVRPVGHLTVATDQSAWTSDQELVLRQAGVDDDVTPAELTGFLHLCQRTGLDPFSRQIYLIGRWDGRAQRKVFTPQTSIEGYRVVRDRVIKRTHGTLSYDDTLWCGPEGEWRDIWLDDDTPPAAAKVTVFRDGGRFSATAKFSEYVQTNSSGTPTSMWKKMPSGQLAKCAEALALRKAFPHDLAGVYTAEEMAQADNPQAVNGEQQRPAIRHAGPVQDEWNTVPPQAIAEQQDRDAEEPQDRPLPPPSPMVPTVTPEQLGELARLLKTKRGAVNGDRNQIVSQLVRRTVDNVQTLSQAEARSIIETLTAEPDRTPPPPETAPATPAVGTPNNPGITDPQQKMLHSLLNKAGRGEREAGLTLINRIIGRTVTSSKELSKAEANTVITKLSSGELPAPTAQPPAPGGFGEFDAIQHMIDHGVGDDEIINAIDAELKAGRITQSDAELLHERLTAREAVPAWT